ncbi:DUF1297 domain-containing protein [Candidatus Micrarchaeota archaeon]|nr:DUF1297 domain-containing protein [Candidatus Micrarchaeota archaeon]MBI5177323.1 DUF1297 domain-containing protein [Candidatus Micrarchaeota archaeon]
MGQNRPITVATLGSHSAIDICEGAKREDLSTLVVCAKGRDSAYSKYYKSRTLFGRAVGCVDEVIVLEKLADVASSGVVEQMRERRGIFVPHKSLTAYAGYEVVEKGFAVPIFGNRMLLHAEERAGVGGAGAKDQNYLFSKAGIRVPRQFKAPSQIDGLAIVKAPDERRGYYERAFFLCSSAAEYERKGQELVEKGVVSKDGLQNALIEEFVLGAQVNFNFFYSPLNGELELMGTDFRRQTNLDGLLRLPAQQQLEVLQSGVRESIVEVGHVAATVRESLLAQAFGQGEKFVDACRREYSPGIIGPFALQGAIAQEGMKETFVVFDASLRVPGSPGTRFTPYSHALWGDGVSVGRRIAMEIKQAFASDQLEKIVT